MSWSRIKKIWVDGTNQLPSDEGVYLIFLYTAEGAYKIRYVGKGKIDERMAHHTSEDEENDCLKKIMMQNNVQFSFKLIEDDDKRSDWEYSLWDYCKNEKKQNLCNKISPDGKKIKIDLPF